MATSRAGGFDAIAGLRTDGAQREHTDGEHSSGATARTLATGEGPPHGDHRSPQRDQLPVQACSLCIWPAPVVIVPLKILETWTGHTLTPLVQRGCIVSYPQWPADS